MAKKDKLGKVQKGSITDVVGAIQESLGVNRPEARQALVKYLKNLRGK